MGSDGIQAEYNAVTWAGDVERRGRGLQRGGAEFWRQRGVFVSLTGSLSKATAEEAEFASRMGDCSKMGLGSFGKSWSGGWLGEGLFDAEKLRRGDFALDCVCYKRLIGYSLEGFGAGSGG
jgi:hypothetical protein